MPSAHMRAAATGTLGGQDSVATVNGPRPPGASPVCRQLLAATGAQIEYWCSAEGRLGNRVPVSPGRVLPTDSVPKPVKSQPLVGAASPSVYRASKLVEGSSG